MEIKLDNLNRYMFDKLDQLFNQGVFEGKKIILFGFNTSSISTEKYLKTKNLAVRAYIDNDANKKKQSGTLSIEDESRIYEPEELLGEYDDQVIVLIASKYYTGMCNQLVNLGYQEGRHIYQTANFYDLDKVLNPEEIYGLEELDNHEIRKLQLDLLRFVKRICEEHGLNYYLCGGTLLGAIRHKGYIPWDDDIDIAMPLPDYKKFLKLVNNDTRYLALTAYTHADSYYNYFMKLADQTTVMKSWEYPFLMTSGVSIDIFPLFGLPDDSESVTLFYNRIRELNTQYISEFLNYESEVELALENRRKLQKEIIKMMEEFDFYQSKKIGYLLSKYREKEIMDRNLYRTSVPVEFEGENFNAAIGYEEYLSIIFGDYGKLPPEGERYTTHNYRAYRK